MTGNIVYHEFMFTPMLLNDLVKKFKGSALNITNKLAVKSMYKLTEVIYDESYDFMTIMLKARKDFSIENMKEFEITRVYDDIENVEDNVWKLHDLLKDSTNIYEIQLFDLLDKTLDNYAKINNILGYFESQIIQDKLKSA